MTWKVDIDQDFEVRHGLGELDEQLDELVEDCLGLGESDRETLNPFELRLESVSRVVTQRVGQDRTWN